MRIRFLLTTLCLLTASAALPVDDDSFDLWPNLDKGQFEVGLKVFHLSDESRAFKLSEQSAEIPRPIQMLLWYPAVKSADSDYMQFKDYVALAASEIDFSKNTEEHHRKEIELFRNWILKRNVKAEDVDRILDSETTVIREAEHASGKFPLIIYVPGFSSLNNNNHILCEFLAGHGYMVAAINSMGAKSRSMTHDISGINAQISDIEFVTNYLESVPGINISKIGTLGHSWGGMTVTIQALRNKRIKAVANFDGTNFSPKWQSFMQQFINISPQKMNASYMHFLSDPPKDSGYTQEWSFLYSLPRDGYALRIKGFRHGDFISLFALFTLRARLPFGDGSTIPEEHISQGFRNVCETALLFYNAYLKEDIKALTHLREFDTPEDVSPGDVVLVRRVLQAK